MTPTDPDEAALRRAVCAAPDDDLPRLVLADYLEERGRPGDADRAAFVRAQCEMERVPWMSARWRKLGAAAERLRRVHGKAWAAVVRGRGVYPRWRRGSVDSLQMYGRGVVKHGAGLLDAEPVREVRLIDLHAPGGVDVHELVRDPTVRRLRGLDFGNTTLSDRDFADVAAAGAGPLAGLRELALRRAEPGVDPARWPAVVRALPRLTALRLESRLDIYTARRRSLAPAVAALAADPAFARLERFELADELAAGAVEALARSPHLTGLRRLHLASGAVTPDAVAALARADALAGLEVLDLSGNPALTDADVRALAGAPFAPALRVLVVRGCGVAKADGKRFAGLFARGEVVV